jgi:hypothetical protein
LVLNRTLVEVAMAAGVPLFGLRGGDGVEGVGHHDERCVAVPGVVAAALVVVQTGLVLPGDPDQFLVVGVGWAVAQQCRCPAA